MKRFLLALVCLSALTFGATKDALAGSDKPVETVTFSFAKIEWEYTPAARGGVMVWDIESNTYFVMSLEEFIFWYFIVGG